MEKINITIVGAGVIGLSIGRELAKEYKDIFIIERNSSFGQETSSRNSEVIHAGIYYPTGSLKHTTCVEGKELIYEFCKKYNIPHKKTGKLIVAIDKDEIQDLEALFSRGLANGVEDLELLSEEELKNLEPNVNAQAAIYSPSTGILDTHSFMKSMASQFQQQGGQIAYQAQLTGIDKVGDGFELTFKEAQGGNFKFFSRTVINCAGLAADKVAAMAGLIKDEYRLKYCKGDYFRVQNNKAFINRLIYPVPKEDRAGLGIHATLDLAGSLRLGPDDEYVDKIDYNIDAAKAKIFYESSKTFLPFIELDGLSPDMAGVRPKLQGPGEKFRDFLIREESESGLTGLINLIGIESPGLTAALSIAAIVKGMVDKILDK